MFVEVLSIAKVVFFYFSLLKHFLESEDGHDFSFCNSHGTPNLIKTLLDRHTVITTELI